MGSPLAPVLANLFMGHHEKLWLRNFKALKFYFIVDMWTTLFVYFTGNMMPFYFSTASFRHPNIRFTMEKEAQHKLPFLNVLVDNNDPNSLLTRVHRKKTFSGL